MALDLNDLCPEGRRWIEQLPPCLDVDQVAGVLASAVRAWHDHDDQAADAADVSVIVCADGHHEGEHHR